MSYIRGRQARSTWNGQPESRRAHTLPHECTRMHSYIRVHRCRCVYERVCMPTHVRTRPCVGADNMQLRAVSSTLSCSRSMRARRTLSLVKRLRHAWRKRWEHTEYADNETLQTPTLIAYFAHIDPTESLAKMVLCSRSIVWWIIVKLSYQREIHINFEWECKLTDI